MGGKQPLGAIIEKHLLGIGQAEPKIKILAHQLMPDHLHVILFVTETIARPVGTHIARMKVLVRKEWALVSGCDSQVFTEDFDDRILYHSRSLDALFTYLAQNPYRLAVRQQFPQYFRRVNRLPVNDHICQAYGNFLLLSNPLKELVMIHRADTAEEKKRQTDRWLHVAANGGVLVSPFISREEKEILRQAEEAGGKIILITNRQMGERFKPPARQFRLCEQGRLLILAPLELAGELTRSTCLRMNFFAAEVAAYVRPLKAESAD